MALHSSTLAWKIPWTEEPGRLQSMGSQRVGHDWVTSLSRIGEGKGNPLQCSCLENPRDGRAWWAAVYGVAESWTWLKWLSSSSSKLLEIFSFFGILVQKWKFYKVLGNIPRNSLCFGELTQQQHRVSKLNPVPGLMSHLWYDIIKMQCIQITEYYGEGNGNPL